MLCRRVTLVSGEKCGDKELALCALAACGPYNARKTRRAPALPRTASLLPFNALENTLVYGQSAERVVGPRLQADLQPIQGRS